MSGTTPALTSGGGTNGLISVDAMQEFRIQTASYAPEYGRMPGGQISIVTKSGSNRWHGTAFDYLRNDFLDARNYFNTYPQPQPALRQNDFGGTFSGPIWKDKTFFFFSYEGLRLLQPTINQGYFLMPSEQALITSAWAPYVGGAPIAAANAPLATAACGANGPDPNPADAAYVACTGLITAPQSNPSRFNAFSIKIDHNLTKKLTLFGRYNRTPSNQGTLSFNENEYIASNIDTMTTGLTWTVNPTMVNDLRGNWSKSTSFETTLDTAAYGAKVLPDSELFPPGLGLNSGSSQAYFATAYGEVRKGSRALSPMHQWNFVDNLSKTVGAHMLKFGIDWRRVHPSTEAGSSLGVYGWNSFSELYNGTVDSVLQELDTPISAHMDNWSFYGQDTWKATRRLTLTYGLRWDINTPPVSDTPGKPLYAVTGIFDSNPLALVNKPLWNTQHDAFAPRLGLAFQFTPHTVLRSGFGMFYDLGYGGTVSGTMGGSFPYAGLNFLFGTYPLDLTNSSVYGLPAFTLVPNAGTLEVDSIDPNLRLPVTYQWNVALERTLGTNQSISATYIGSDAKRLLYSDRIVPTGSIFQTSGSGGYVTALRNAAYSHYNALQLQFKRRMSHGLQVLASYSLAKSSDLSSNEFGDIFYPSVSAAVLPPLTPSDFDIRNSASAAVSYDIPAPGWGKAGHAVFGGWATDGIFRASSGPPIDVQMGSYNSVVTYDYVRPALVPGQPTWIPDPTQPAGKALNPDAFTLPPNGASNDALRNTIRSPYGIDQMDLAVRRRFSITERVKLDFRAEYFNLFNHPMFGGQYAPYAFWGFCYSQPCTGQQFSQFGKVWPSAGATLNLGLGGGGLSGGQSAQYAVGGARSGQVTLKLTF
jgi:hypothetical protein